jgi:hypothetical protein
VTYRTAVPNAAKVNAEPADLAARWTTGKAVRKMGGYGSIRLAGCW